MKPIKDEVTGKPVALEQQYTEASRKAKEELFKKSPPNFTLPFSSHIARFIAAPDR